MFILAVTLLLLLCKKKKSTRSKYGNDVFYIQHIVHKNRTIWNEGMNKNVNVSMGVGIIYANSCILCESLNNSLNFHFFMKFKKNNVTAVHRFGQSKSMAITCLLNVNLQSTAKSLFKASH